MGSCGNFNGDASDDTTPAIFERVGARVEAGANLFSRRVPVEFTSQMDELRMDATAQQMSACLFDGCFGMNEHALQTAKQFAMSSALIGVLFLLCFSSQVFDGSAVA